MPLQSSGQISLNDMHVEAGGTSGTQCSMNDSDIRGLVNASANSQMTFSSFYGASAVQPYSAVITIGYSVFKTSNYVAFLCEGSVRLIIHKENGDEITARILQDNSFIIDPYRLKGTDSSPLSIECLEDLTLLIASLESIQKLLETNLALNILVRKYQKEKMLEMAEIQFLFLTGTAKERYQRILENNPEMLRKFPLRFIASMIGITPTQLSRVRKKK